MEIDLTSRGRQGGKSQDTRVALWYYRRHHVYVDLCSSMREAAESAYTMLADGGGSPEGVQFPDGRFVFLANWDEYRKVLEERRRAEELEAAQRPEPLRLRQVQVPWDYEQRTVEIPAELPEWVGGKQDA